MLEDDNIPRVFPDIMDELRWEVGYVESLPDELLVMVASVRRANHHQVRGQACASALTQAFLLTERLRPVDLGPQMRRSGRSTTRALREDAPPQGLQELNRGGEGDVLLFGDTLVRPDERLANIARFQQALVSLDKKRPGSFNARHLFFRGLDAKAKTMQECGQPIATVVHVRLVKLQGVMRKNAQPEVRGAYASQVELARERSCAEIQEKASSISAKLGLLQQRMAQEGRDAGLLHL